MASQEQLALLKCGAKEWNAWRAANPNLRPDLGDYVAVGRIEQDPGREGFLREPEFYTDTLFNEEWPLGTGADLRGCELSGADLSRADLTLADLDAADLRGADLREADLFLASLADADLRGARLHRADLRGANFGGWDTVLRPATLAGAEFRAALFTLTDLRGTNFTRADLSGADLRGVDLSSALLVSTKLRGANLDRAKLSHTTLADLDLAATEGLETVRHAGPSTIDLETLRRAEGRLPPGFLHGIGLPEALIHALPSLWLCGGFHRCFISYSHEDREFALRLYSRLQDRGVRCWLDEHEILPGEKLLDAVHRGITSSDKVLLCCSQSSLHSPWVDREIEQALSKEERLWRERGQATLVVIPLDLDGELHRWQSGKAALLTARRVLDFCGWQADAERFEAQLETLAKALAVAAPEGVARTTGTG